MENELILMITPIVATIVSTIMGTELFKKLFPNATSRTVTYIVWGLVAVVVWLILDLFPWWLTAALLLVSSGLYSSILKVPIGWAKNAISSDRNPPIGGGGGGPRP